MKRLAGAAVAVLVAAGAVVLTLPDKSAGGTTVEVRADPVRAGARVVAAAGLTNDLLMASKLGALADGGAAVFLDLLLDGGERVQLDTMPCVRRPAGLTDCRRVVAPTPGAAPVASAVADWQRFLAAEAVGAECEPVPCSVWAGDAPNP